METFHPDRDPLFYRLMANRAPFKDGWYALPQGPGFGLELDPEVIATYRVDGKIEGATARRANA
jgi:L-alanine-DL-glutamate epimerase-like enolase superfamily enzyme